MTKPTPGERYTIKFKREAVRRVEGGQFIAAATRTLDAPTKPRRLTMAGCGRVHDHMVRNNYPTFGIPSFIVGF